MRSNGVKTRGKKGAVTARSQRPTVCPMAVAEVLLGVGIANAFVALYWIRITEELGKEGRVKMREMAMKHRVFLIAVLLLQSSTFAMDFAGGTGEPNDPYKIATAEQLPAIGSDPGFLDMHIERGGGRLQRSMTMP